MNRLHIYMDEYGNNPALALMNAIFSRRVMRRVIKKYRNDKMLFLHTPLCCHGYFDYYNREEAECDIKAFLKLGYYVLVGEDWGEYALINGYDNHHFLYIETEKEQDMYRLVSTKKTFEQFLIDCGYFQKFEDEKRIQIRTIKPNSEFVKEYSKFRLWKKGDMTWSKY